MPAFRSTGNHKIHKGSTLKESLVVDDEIRHVYVEFICVLSWLRSMRDLTLEVKNLRV